MSPHVSPSRIKRVSVVTLFAFFSLLGAQSYGWEGDQCSDFLAEGLDRGGVQLSADEARLYDIGARGVLKVMFLERFSADEKIRLWRSAVQSYREREPFINDEVWFKFDGADVVAFVGVASGKQKSLLFVMPDGRVFLTHTPDYLQTVIERAGGGLKAAVDGIYRESIEADDFLHEYLANILRFAMGEPL